MRALIILGISAILAGCAAAPKPINVVRGEACWRCKQPINNERIAAEQIGSNGLASKFRTIHCLSTWIAQQAKTPDGRTYVANYDQSGWIRADRAAFVRVIVNRDTMERDFIAFADPQKADEAARANQSAVVGWDAVLDLGRTQPIGGN